MNLTGEDTSVQSLIPEKRSKINLRKTVILVVSSIFILSVLVGTVCFYVFRDEKNSDDLDNLDLKSNTVANEIRGPICSLKDSEKFDCYPDTPVTENQCLQRGCCYKATSSKGTNSSGFPPLGVPYCYYPADYPGYTISDLKCDKDKCQASLTKGIPSGFPNYVKNLLLDVTFIDDNIVRVKIIDASTERFEVPIPLNDDVKPKKDPLYSVFLTADGSLIINRRSSNLPVFSTNLSRLVYADQFLQISSSLSSTYLYGIGEQKAGVLRNLNWTRFTLFNRDREPVSNKNLYGSHPFYIVLENDGLANGAFLYNSNAMDIILQPTPAINFGTIGGILDLFVILGTSPQDVIQHYTNIVGRTFMPPYWSLGFHLCKFGYNSLNNTRAVYQRMKDAQIPYDVQWNDIDYMDGRKDFTYDKVKFQGLPEFVDELHKNGMHYVIMTDPGLSSSEEPGTYPPYDEGVAKDLFIKNSTGQIFQAKVWTKGLDVFPDFSHPDAESFWEDQFVRFHPEVEFDGVWIDMNEPSNMYDGQINGCPNSTLENPPYLPGGDEPLYTKTVCMTAKHYSTVHYNEHNLLSYREAKATVSALRKVRPDKRPFIISRATFIGQGVHSGHWSGDISSTWEDLRYSIPSLLNFNMYGMSMVGSDICGFNGNTTVELCARWQALGAFYPFSRNHNDIEAVDQDPPILGPIVIEATKKSLNARYYLLPYLYTLFYRSHAFGETVARPLFFEFTTDVKTYNIDEQFLWGPALMIIPVLYPNVTSVNAYFPKGKWYNFVSGESRSSTGQEFTLSIPITEIDLEVRGGYILPLQPAATTTTESRKNDFDLFVALDDKKEASGELYWDDGDTLDTYENGIYNLFQFSAKSDTLNSSIVKSNYTTSMNLGNIKIYGVDKSPSQVKINSESVPFKFDKNNLVINAKGASLLKSLIVTWT